MANELQSNLMRCSPMRVILSSCCLLNNKAPLLPHKISAESALPPLVDSISSNLEHLAPDVAAAAPVGRRVVANNLLDGSIQELDLLALNELSISCSSSGEPNTLLESTDDDPFSSLSLTVQGRIIPCIPCENISPTGQQLPPSN